MRDTIDSTAFNFEQGQRARKLFAAVVLAALDDAIADDKKYGNGPDQIARWVPGRFVPLGTDGFGMSDTRDALRRHFEVDGPSITVAALDALRRDGRLDGAYVDKAIAKLGIDPGKRDPARV